MIWWRWDSQQGCWQPTAVRQREPLDVNGGARLVPVAGGRRWGLLVGGNATVNGRAALPLEILDDRDEIGIGGERHSFGAQSPAEVVAFGQAGNVRCARCLGRLGDGDRVVRCPDCTAYHHAPCWTYDAGCQKCGFLTHAALPVPDPLN
jgi:hypothetical protein